MTTHGKQEQNMKQTVLIAEDDRDIVELLSLYLSGEGYEILSADNGIDALDILKTKEVSMALVDIMMPKMNGYDLLRRMREFSNIPVIILSARNMDPDRILGLNLGADAYLTKPFNPLEVVAYVKASLRRFYQLGSDAREETVYTVGQLRLDLRKFELTKNGSVIALTSTELKILSMLMKSPGRIFTKAQLYECINGDAYSSEDNTMMVHISNIRSKIEDDPSSPAYIITQRGLGYKIEIP